MPDSPSPTLFVSTLEAARLLAVSPRTLRGLVAAGKIKSACVGRRRLVPRAELERLVAEAMREGGAQ